MLNHTHLRTVRMYLYVHTLYLQYIRTYYLHVLALQSTVAPDLLLHTRVVALLHACTYIAIHTYLVSNVLFPSASSVPPPTSSSAPSVIAPQDSEEGVGSMVHGYLRQIEELK